MTGTSVSRANHDDVLPFNATLPEWQIARDIGLSTARRRTTRGDIVKYDTTITVYKVRRIYSFRCFSRSYFMYLIEVTARARGVARSSAAASPVQRNEEHT